MQIPADAQDASAILQVVANGQASATRTIPLAPMAPGVFFTTTDRKAAGAITHSAAGTEVDFSHPASLGEVVVIYATGLGQVMPAVAPAFAPSIASSTPTCDMVKTLYRQEGCFGEFGIVCSLNLLGSIRGSYAAKPAK